MGRGRFVVILVALCASVGLGAFAVGLQVLDDGQPDPPPRGSSSVTSLAPLAEGSTTQPTTATPSTGAGLATPAWVAVVASEGSEAGARAKSAPLGEAGYPTGVLHSDDYSSLKPGLWVAYAGPYPDQGAADDAVDSLAADGFAGAYSRCVGSAQDCGGGGG